MPKFISPENAIDCAKKLAGVMKDGFANATSTFSEDQELSDNFGKVLNQMTQFMLSIIDCTDFNECCKNECGRQ